MTSGRTSGDLSAIVIREKQVVIRKINENYKWFFIYLFSGKVRIDIIKKIHTINKGDLLVINKPTLINLEIEGIENSELVLSEITTHFSVNTPL